MSFCGPWSCLGTILASLIVGVGVGGASAIYLSTPKGREMKERARERIRKIGRKEEEATSTAGYRRLRRG